jgi:hypothetical protein
MLNLSWLDTEQSFLHQRVLMQAKKLDKEQLLEIFEEVHRQHLLHKRFFSGLVCWCVKNGITLPPLTDLLVPRELDRRSIKEDVKCEPTTDEQ